MNPPLSFSYFTQVVGGSAHTTHGPGGVLRDGLVQSALSLLLIPPKTTWLLFLRAPWQTTNGKKEKKIIMEELKKKTTKLLS